MGFERQYKVCNFGMKEDPLIAQTKERGPLVSQAKGEIPLVSQAMERDPLVTQADLSALGVCSPAVTLLHKKGPRHRRKIYVNYL